MRPARPRRTAITPSMSDRLQVTTLGLFFLGLDAVVFALNLGFFFANLKWDVINLGVAVFIAVCGAVAWWAFHDTWRMQRRYGR